VKAVFSELARERSTFAEELRQQAQRLGAELDDGGSFSGAVPRGWMDVTGEVKTVDDASIIAEAERGEDVAVATYENALATSLPTPVHFVLERQYLRVRHAHDRVRALEKEHDHRR
jgi:uncharacterized protein (TIGR02284 family)